MRSMYWRWMVFSPFGHCTEEKHKHGCFDGGEERLGEALRHPIYIVVMEIQGERGGANVSESDGEREPEREQRCEISTMPSAMTTRIHGLCRCATVYSSTTP
jgi:hypothetical protein